MYNHQDDDIGGYYNRSGGGDGVSIGGIHSMGGGANASIRLSQNNLSQGITPQTPIDYIPNTMPVGQGKAGLLE
jgi:hypothetical protein